MGLAGQSSGRRNGVNQQNSHNNDAEACSFRESHEETGESGDWQWQRQRLHTILQSVAGLTIAAVSVRLAAASKPGSRENLLPCTSP